MSTIGIDKARAHLASLVKAAAAGEEIVITKYGKPVARLSAFAPPRRQLGRLNGKFHVPDDFDRLHEEEIRRLFEEGC